MVLEVSVLYVAMFSRLIHGVACTLVLCSFSWPCNIHYMESFHLRILHWAINIYTVFSWNIYKFVGIFLFILGIYSRIGLWGHIGTLIFHHSGYTEPHFHEQSVITPGSPHPAWLLHGSDSDTSTRGTLQQSRHHVSDAPLLRWCQAGLPAFPAAFLLTPCIEAILQDQMKPECPWCVCSLGSKLNSNDTGSVCFAFLFLVSRYSYFP